MWDDADFDSPDPLVRFNAHMAAKGRTQLPDPDLVRKALKERGVHPGCTCGGRGACTVCCLREFEEEL